MQRVDQFRKNILGMKGERFIELFVGGMFFGGLATLLSVGSYGGNRWIRHLDPDSAAPRDIRILIWMFLFGMVVFCFSLVGYRGEKEIRNQFLKNSQGLSLSELLDLASEKECNEWVRWIIRRRVRESGKGHREYIAAVHFDDNVCKVSDDLGAVEESIEQLAALFAQADRMMKANPLPWTLRLTYFVPILTLVWSGWAASWIWMFPEWARLSSMVVMFVGLHFPLVLIGVVGRRRVGTIEEDVKKVLSTVPTWALVRFSGARLYGASLELMRRSRAKDKEAKRGLRAAELIRTKSRLSGF
jgi:hypothetical protein